MSDDPTTARASAIEREMLDGFIPRRAVIALMRAADRTRRMMVRTLQEFDLTLPQFNVLTVLLQSEELPTFDVAARLVEETPGITRLMNTLVAKRLIRRRPCAEDRRQQLCSLTPAGRRVVESVIPRFDETQSQVVQGLKENERLALVALLCRVAI